MVHLNILILIKRITLLYTDVYSCTTNNGYSSEWFEPTRGLRQGCPLSPYLFLLCGEIFANLIRDNKKIKGIKIGQKEIKLSQYADDTSLFSMYDKTSLDGITEILNKAERNMGLKANYEKTSIYLKHSIPWQNYTLKRILNGKTHL